MESFGERASKSLSLSGMTRFISRRKARSKREPRPGTELSPQMAPPKRTYFCKFATSFSLSTKSRDPVKKMKGGLAAKIRSLSSGTGSTIL